MIGEMPDIREIVFGLVECSEHSIADLHTHTFKGSGGIWHDPIVMEMPARIVACACLRANVEIDGYQHAKAWLTIDGQPIEPHMEIIAGRSGDCFSDFVYLDHEISPGEWLGAESLGADALEVCVGVVV